MSETKLYPKGSLAQGLNDLRDRAHDVAVEKGWWEPQEVWASLAEPEGEMEFVRVQRTFGELMALVHSETSEALEDYRAGMDPATMMWQGKGEGSGCLSTEPTEVHAKPVGIPSEMADIIIRVMDVCGFYGIDIEEAVRVKMAYNATRPHRHGGKAL